mmetsp:Transcript_1220/g.2897  ORF Transcript_1220/g.2897 Transcript_1220/m.2897 type:complete len:206 (+) Transcript_1220:1998-2615(+)
MSWITLSVSISTSLPSIAKGDDESTRRLPLLAFSCRRPSAARHSSSPGTDSAPIFLTSLSGMRSCPAPKARSQSRYSGWSLVPSSWWGPLERATSNVSTGTVFPPTSTSRSCLFTVNGCFSMSNGGSARVESTTMLSPRRSKGASDLSKRLLPSGRWCSRACTGCHSPSTLSSVGASSGPRFTTSLNGIISSPTPSAFSQSRYSG